MAASGPTDLLDIVNLSVVECLNQKPEQPVENALKQGLRDDDGLYLESDTDEQLLIHIPFRQCVKLHSICILGPDDGRAPLRVKLFINNPTIGFSEASDSPATQEAELTEENIKGMPILLRFVKFQNVTCLSLFIESNQQDEDTTRVTKITVQGFSGEVMNVAAIKDQQKQG